MSCERKGKWLRGCKFEARFDISAADVSRFKNISSDCIADALDRMRQKTYVKDVCVTCGKTIMRDEKVTNYGQ